MIGKLKQKVLAAPTVLAGASISLIANTALAQADWKLDHAVTLVVPNVAVDGTDATARTLSRQLGTIWASLWLWRSCRLAPATLY